MMKKILCSLLIVLTVPMLMSSVKAPVSNGPKKPLISTIIVDAGHGGHDRGAKGDYSFEKDICLAIALKLGRKLEEEFPNVKILYTRTGDSYPPNRSRADFANSNKGDLYISIHVNAAPKIKHSKFAGYKTQVYYTGKGKNKKKRTRKVPKYNVYYTDNPSRGTETFIWASDRTDEKGDFVGERVHEEFDDSTEVLPDINDPEFKAKSLLWTKRFFDKSLLLATLVEEEFVKEGRPSRGVKQRNERGIWVLQATAMPSILVETGFITHRPDEDYLNSKKGQEEIANNVVSAVKRYKTATESSVNASSASKLRK
jgi:N-acetylmuramoyl-L-alanine amidase